MRKLLIILSLVLVSLFGYGQGHYPTFTDGFGKTLVFQGSDLTTNTLEMGLLLKLIASAISEDSLTYNSSGNLVSYSNLDTVRLDSDPTEVVIGNSVRFGTPTAGTIYQIADTGISDSILILDQNFTGSITDEFYWGGVGKWYDESNEENHATQATAINQPKLLWYGTDTAQVYFDGINDYCDFNEIKNIGKIHSIYNELKFNDFTPLNTIYSYSADYNIRYFSSGHTYRVNGATYSPVFSFSVDQAYKTVITRDNQDLEYYSDGISYGTRLIAAPNNVNFIFRELGRRHSLNDLYMSGEIMELRIYNRELTNNEIQALSQ